MGDTHDHDHDGHDEARCEEALAELYTFLDGELTEAKRLEIRAHLDDCSPCLEVFDFEAELRMVVRQRCRDQVPESLRQRVAERLAAAIEVGADRDVTDGGAPAGSSGPAAPATSEGS